MKNIDALAEYPLIMSVRDLQDFMEISQTGAYSLTQCRRFPAARIGNRVMIFKNDFINWLKEGEVHG